MQTQHPAAFNAALCRSIHRRSDEKESIRHSTAIKNIKKLSVSLLIDQFLAAFRSETERSFADSLQAAVNLLHLRIHHSAEEHQVFHGIVTGVGPDEFFDYCNLRLA